MIPKLVKAEILFTRKCNLGCPSCAIVSNKYEELDIDGWKKAFDGLKKVGVPFAAIYGAEPFCRFNDLCELVGYSESIGIMTTVITNGLLMTDEKMQKLYESGLRSLTMSCDDLPDKLINLPRDVARKSQAAYNWMSRWMEFKDIRDGQVCMTVTRKNFKSLPEFIELWSRLGVYTAWDILHYDQGQPGSKCSPMSTEEISDLCLNASNTDNMFDMLNIMHKVLKMKKDGYKIFPFEENIKDWLTISFRRCDYRVEQKWGRNLYAEWEFGDLAWKCSPTTFVTIDCDGTAQCCDDFLINKPKIYAWELADKWEAFDKRNKKAVKSCPGCQWATHRSAERIFNGECQLEGYVHGLGAAAK